MQTMQCKVQSAQCTLQCTVHSAQCTLHSAQCTVHSAVFSAQCTVYSAQRTVNSAQRTVYSTQSNQVYILKTVHWRLQPDYPIKPDLFPFLLQSVSSSNLRIEYAFPKNNIRKVIVLKKKKHSVGFFV